MIFCWITGLFNMIFIWFKKVSFEGKMKNFWSTFVDFVDTFTVQSRFDISYDAHFHPAIVKFIFSATSHNFVLIFQVEQKLLGPPKVAQLSL